MPRPPTIQLKLGKAKHQSLTNLIELQYSQDSTDLERRNKRLAKWYRMSRNASDINSYPDSEDSNFSVPMILWQMLAKLAKEMDALLGEGSEIAVTPIGESDVDRVPKIRRWMNWRLKHSLKLFNPMYDYLMNKYRYGLTIGNVAWETKTRLVKKKELVFSNRPGTPDPNTGLPTIEQVQTGEQIVEREVVDFDGPSFTVENLEDWVFPVNTKDVVESDHFVRILRLSMDEVFDLRDSGDIDDKLLTKKNVDELRRISEQIHGNQSPERTSEEVRDAKDDIEEIPSYPLGGKGEIPFWNWYGRFRVEDSDERATELVGFYQPHMKKLFGISRLVDKFPDGRRPFVSSQMISDPNRAFGIGLCELLEPLQDEMDALTNITIDAGMRSIAPTVFFEPASGFNPETHEIGAGVGIPVQDASKINVLNMGQVNMAPYVQLKQDIMGYGEKITGFTDAQLGRTSEAPNAPRTFGQASLLQAESNVRLLMDIRLERESLRELLKRIWELDKEFVRDDIFFRVTEEEEGDVMTSEDMQGSYDFDIGPITSIANRQLDDQKLSQAFQMASGLGIQQITIPLLGKILKSLGQGDVAKNLPDLEAAGPPMTPDEENIRTLQGEDVDPHPLDNHVQHIAKHTEFMQRMQGQEVDGNQFGLGNFSTTIAAMNPGLIGRIQAHIDEHKAAASGNPSIPQGGAQSQQGQLPLGPPNGGGGLQQPGDARSAQSAFNNSGGLNLG